MGYELRIGGICAMWSKMKMVFVGICLSLFLAGIMVSGCSKYATQDEMRRLEEQRKATLSAEQKLQECSQARGDLQRQVKEKQALVEKLTKDRDAVKQ